MTYGAENLINMINRSEVIATAIDYWIRNVRLTHRCRVINEKLNGR